ncbi:hypothetical protein Thethe_02199 [Thermoanaerobacterium thermosaccharolyticum M0795]|uniref:Uncharacterized protein n=3 Tax=Thermoanaerobacterium thermosaccharolyticum TaxID=1517 RepID=D9TRL4_THETC|nr:hypothetical protein [Thermoanaerobacterium thermosaccharolyticum]ADL69598.1 hypothetical protein Tthe_2120 [Thermoanaerobacterium thermosaccharolyticum DSM 571]AGB19774.1 hypothetical protein Thethe_02199 [Thermoanaerobacterium thermosaccharolyticum M0795]TCW42145.1 hypothetical protein EDC21_10271 [Thermohydrogenium kirishiense]MBE0067826.1 hypothetical protein [Thermoanaerobacterium thermosaccharolyticum]MBE0227389.1 hypothetical protein [Thermoanaerobacterium thermosaccharolyticum]
MTISGNSLLFFFVILTVIIDVKFEFEDLLFFFVLLVVLQQDKPRKKARRFLWSLATMNI